jgi:hypothetical protein
MPRARERYCLEQGLKLNINQLIRVGMLRPGAKTGPYGWTWTNTHTGELVANALITANMENERGGWFRIQIGDLDQWIDLVTQRRHFGGRQWYFRCLAAQRCSVVWRFGQGRFYSRAAWGPRYAYASQVDTPVDRAHRGKAKIKARLIDDLDPDEWALPPKPKWMRWHTYDKQVEKFDHYEGQLNVLCSRALQRILNQS